MFSKTDVFENVLWFVTLVILVVIVGYPLAMLLYGALTSDGKLTFRAFEKVVTDPHLPRYVINTLKLATVVTLMSLAIGVPLAWLVTRTDFPWRNVVRILATVPFVVPPYLLAMGWISLADPSIGIVNRIYRALGGEGYIVNIYGFWGLALVMAFRFYVYVFLLTSAALERLDPSLEEAARICGASMARVARDVTLPLVAPSIVAGALLTFVATCENFGIPALIGDPAYYFVLTTRIYAAIDMFDLETAAAYSFVLLAISIPLLFVQRWVSKKGRYVTITGRATRPSVIKLGRSRYLALVLTLIILIPSSISPIVSLVLTSFLRTVSSNIFDPSSYTLENVYEVLFVNPDTQRAVIDSLMLALSSATVVTLLGMVVAYIVARFRTKARFVIDWLASAPFALPGTVFALAMIFAFIWTPIYNTLTLVFLAYVARYLAYGVRTLSGAVLQIDPSLEEAARVCGASRIRTLKDVVAPLTKPAMVASWILVFMPTLSELTVSVVLAPPNYPTIGKAVYDLMEEGAFEWAYALSFLVVVIVLVCQALARLIARKVGAELG